MVGHLHLLLCHLQITGALDQTMRAAKEPMGNPRMGFYCVDYEIRGFIHCSLARHIG